jgi:hypothetical protein
MTVGRGALRRTLAVAELQARDLLRRRVVMALLVLLPAAFYYSIPAGEEYGILAGSIGVCWAVAAAGMFGILGWRHADPRLGLAGARPAEGLLGRLLLLVVVAVGLVVLFTPQIVIRSADLIADVPVFALGLLLMALVSVPLGLAVGALVPRELEGTLLLVGVVGIETSVPHGTALAAALPLWGPLEVMQLGAGRIDGPATVGIAHAGASALLLLGVAAWSWQRRTQPRLGRHRMAAERLAVPMGDR